MLGHLPSLLGGRIELRRDLAEKALRRVADPLGLSVQDAALGIVDVVNDRMLGGLRLVSIQRGHDPRTFTLVAFGGAGPLHANAMLELLDSPLCVIPPAPGIFSTFGFLAADELPVVHDDPAADPELPATLAGRFGEAHRRFYQFDLEVEPELVVVRCIATGLKPRPEIRAHEEAAEPVEAAVTDPEHVIYRQGGWVRAPIYARERLQPGHELPGPAVVEQEDSTRLIHPGFRARVDRFLNLILQPA